jgi:hypothetical protein
MLHNGRTAGLGPIVSPTIGLVGGSAVRELAWLCSVSVDGLSFTCLGVEQVTILVATSCITLTLAS